MATFITPVEITPSTLNAWVDVDCSASVPAGASGIIFHVVNKTTTSVRCGWRKNGSTDARTVNAQIWISEDSHGWASVGVDASRIAEFYVDDATNLDIWLVGYFGADAVFLTNAVDKSIATLGAYQTIDISTDTGANTAIAAIMETSGNDAAATLAYRHPSSTDDISSTSVYHCQFIVPLSASETFQVKIGDLSNDMWLIGYIVSDFVAHTNKVDMSLGGTGAWTDLSALPAGAIGAVIEVVGTTLTDRYGLRQNGSAENIVSELSTKHAMAIVPCDASRLIEGQINSTAVDFYRVGYFTAPTNGAPVKGQYYARMRG